MDNKEKPKTRRPLPTPGVVPAQRPNTPIPGALNASAVAPASFYGTTKPPIPPTRSGTTGSSHTTFIRPDDPPAYAASSSTPAFREPELVTEEPMDSLSTSTDWAGKSGAATFWSSDSNSWPNAVDPWEEFSNKTSAADTWGPTGYDQMDYMSSKTFLDVTIDGRDDYEERNWWDPALREKESRPGPGMLPTVLAEELHNPDHSLFSVIVTSPEVQPSNLTASSLPAVPNSPSLARNAWGSPSPQSTTSSPPGPSTSTTSPPPPPPTESEVRTAVPHPNAYYCPKENGWVILSWKSSSVSPPLAKSFKNSKLHSLPDQARRRRAESCTKDQPISPANKTHHFHKYAKAVDAHKLTPPLNMDDWEVEESIKVKHRSQSIVEDIDITKLTPEDLQKMMEEGEEEEEGRLLDLYVCCQCSFYCIASGVIPGVIPRRCFDEFIRDKRNNPQVGKTGEEAILIAFETLIIIIENKLWKGENRLLPVTRPSFRSKLGWNDNFKRTFSVLGFTEEELEGATALRPPVTDTTTAVGKINRRKLLRAWVEVNAWLADFKRTNGMGIFHRHSIVPPIYDSWQPQNLKTPPRKSL
ncbi:hypothetical protein H0H81_009677 [Sphagnurus paluster]|uniref:Uncharacterized protein n=1 Tax=Sphagnurus paluster TaxID=117069 RepID=A0A9P7FRG9_9AGAR|nr:hypothetical protein H0H81_009677 [Sphagnurus paluster]